MRKPHNPANIVAPALLVFGLSALPAVAADRTPEAQALQMRGDWNGLKRLATDWSRTDPQSPAPWLYLGAADDQLNQTAEAITAYERAVALDPRLVTGWMFLAADYHKTAQPQKLAQAVDKLKAANPSMAMMLQSQYAADLRSGQPSQAASGVSGVPQKAAAALARARQWRPDAQLMQIDINDFSNNGNFLTAYYFRSPSNGSGLIVNDTSSLPVAAANWGTAPVSAGFTDLPDAVNQARAQGMQGAYNHALLRVGDHGLTWTITPVFQGGTQFDPYARRGAFEVPAGR